MKNSASIFLLAVVACNSFAQQDAQYSQNMFNHLTVNPGFAGLKKSFCTTLIGRRQWVDFPGAPATYLVSLDAYLPNLSSGGGLTVAGDNLGNEKNTLARLAYSFHRTVGNATIGFGIEAGSFSKSLTASWITPEDPGVSGWDPSIPYEDITSTNYDVGLGIYYFAPKLKLGLSSSHITQQTLGKPERNDVAKNGIALDYKMRRHYYLSGEYVFNKGTWDFIPSVLAKSDATSLQLDMNLIALWRHTVWGGASFRIQDAFVFMAGFQRSTGKANDNVLKIGYAYDLTRSALKNHSRNSHEIMINYCFKLPPRQESHITVRNM